jgi:transcriptional regulator with XRE-family HTH domain
MNVQELITELVNRHGQGTLADMIGVDGSTMSRFRSGQGTTSLEKLFELARVELVPRADLEGFEYVLSFVTNLWNRERSKRKEE